MASVFAIIGCNGGCCEIMSVSPSDNDVRTVVTPPRRNAVLNEPGAACEAFCARKCGKRLWGFRCSRLGRFGSLCRTIGATNHAARCVVARLEMPRIEYEAPWSTRLIPTYMETARNSEFGQHESQGRVEHTPKITNTSKLRCHHGVASGGERAMANGS